MVVSMSRWVTRMSFIYFAHAAFSRQTVANQGQAEPILTSSCPHVHCMSYGQWQNGTHGPTTPRHCRIPEPRPHTERQSVVQGKCVSVRVDIGGCRTIKKT